jgi:hypothetical protein
MSLYYLITAVFYTAGSFIALKILSFLPKKLIWRPYQIDQVTITKMLAKLQDFCSLDHKDDETKWVDQERFRFFI